MLTPWKSLLKRFTKQTLQKEPAYAGSFLFFLEVLLLYPFIQCINQPFIHKPEIFVTIGTFKPSVVAKIFFSTTDTECFSANGTAPGRHLIRRFRLQAYPPLGGDIKRHSPFSSAPGAGNNSRSFFLNCICYFLNPFGFFFFV